MASEVYFFDQRSSKSHIGPVHRTKRNLDDFYQALFDVQRLFAQENKVVTQKEIKLFKINDINLQKKLILSNKFIIPDILMKELDKILRKTLKRTDTTNLISSSSSSFNSLKFVNEDIDSPSNQPNISLPSRLIIEFHSKWSDLIQNTEYSQQMWCTKDGEKEWRAYVKFRRNEQLNSKTYRSPNNNKSFNISQKHLKMASMSLTNLTRRKSLTIKSNSSMSQSLVVHDKLKPNKSVKHQTPSNILEKSKDGVHLRFKFSTENVETVRNAHNSQNKIALFDIPKQETNHTEYAIALQNKCKQLLAEMKKKISDTTEENSMNSSKICKIYFYEEDYHMRRANYLSTFAKQKSKFVFSILRHEIPETYNFTIDLPGTKHKFYIELLDGSCQIYYPSGRLAFLRLRPPFSTAIFFDDTNIKENQFLGLVTSAGRVILMKPTYHAYFIASHRRQLAYLCNGKSGSIQKEVHFDSTNNNENSIRYQLNSYMTLEYHDSSNIKLKFACQEENFSFQLGVDRIADSTIHSDSTKLKSVINEIHSDELNDSINTTENQRNKSTKTFKELPVMQELLQIKQRVKDICHDWLQYYRTTLGVMDIDAYCLYDVSSHSIVTETKQRIDDPSNCKSSSVKALLEKRNSFSENLLKPINRRRIIENVSRKATNQNMLEDTFEKIIPYSDTGQIFKKQTYLKKSLSSRILPPIKCK